MIQFAKFEFYEALDGVRLFMVAASFLFHCHLCLRREAGLLGCEMCPTSLFAPLRLRTCLPVSRLAVNEIYGYLRRIGKHQHLTLPAHQAFLPGLEVVLAAATFREEVNPKPTQPLMQLSAFQSSASLFSSSHSKPAIDNANSGTALARSA